MSATDALLKSRWNKVVRTGILFMKKNKSLQSGTIAIKTKIVATIGPSSNSKAVLKKLISSGLNVARLNFSHGSHEEHSEVIKRIRALSKELNKPIGILLDLQGPKIRTGKLNGNKPVLLKRNATFCITSKQIIEISNLFSEFETVKKYFTDLFLLSRDLPASNSLLIT